MRNISSHLPRFTVVALALWIALLGQTQIHAAKIIYFINTIVDPNTAANANDQEVIDRLKSQGHTVTLADDDDTSITAAQIATYELVLISSSTGSGNAGINPLSRNVFRTGRVPVICYEPGLYDELLFQIETTFGNAGGHTSLAISSANRTHPLAAGKSGTIDIVNPGDTATISSSALPYTIGTNAIVIATNATPDIDVGRICIWGYDTGARLADNATVVPSRRVAFFYNASTPPGAYNENAQALFDAAVKWALESAPKGLPPTVSITSPATGATFPAGASVTINATASDPDGTVAKVEFYEGTNKIGEDTSSPYSFTWSNVASGKYVLSARAIDNTNNQGVSAEVSIVVGTPPPEILLVVGAPPGNASETAIMNRLRGQGFIANSIDDDAALPANVNDRVLIIVSSTSGSGNITKYRDVPVPIVNWEWAAYDGLGMADGDGQTIDNSETQIEIVDDKHPLAAGLPKGVRPVFNAPAAQFAVGDPVPSAAVVALATDGSGRAALFGFEKGAALSEAAVPGLKAPARRVGIFLGGNTFNGLNEDGLKIFDAAIRWALGRSATPPTISIASPADKATLPAGSPISITVNAASAGGTVAKVEFFADGAKIGEATASPFSFTWSNPPSNRRVVLTAKVTDNTGDSATSAPVNIVVGTPPQQVLLIVGSVSAPGALNPSDAAIKARVQALGFDVREIADAASTTADANGVALVITSSTVSSGNVGDKFRSVPVPVLNWEQALQDNYLMTTDQDGVTRGTLDGQTAVNITNAAHPLAAGLGAGVKTIATTAGPFSWGVPGAGAVVVATIADDPTRAVVYAYDTGATLVDGATKAPARRVHFFLGDAGYVALNADGQKLFDAALNYALNRSSGTPPKFNAPTVQGRNMTISWTGTGTLQQADSVTGPWTDAPSQANPQTVAITGAAKFYRLRQ